MTVSKVHLCIFCGENAVTNEIYIMASVKERTVEGYGGTKKPASLLMARISKL